ncbi:MAG: sensor histidine kinase [Prolixibacteraceae bacterium]
MQADFLKKKMDETKDMVLNRILIVLLFFMVIGISISLLRVAQTGFKLIYGVQIFLALVMILLYVFQRKLSTKVKGGIFLVSLLGMGLSGLLSFGLYGFGYTYFIPASAIAYLYFSHRTGWIFTASSLVLLILIAVAFSKGILHFQPESANYMESWTMWMNMFITVLLIAIVITMFWNNLYNLLNSTFTHIHYQQEDMKKMNEQLIVARDQAQESDKLKSAFLQNISHEIRTPLNIIIGFSDMVAHTEDANEQREFNKVIRDNSNNMLKIVNDIVDFSKIETNTLNLKPTSFNVKEVLADIAKMYKVQQLKPIQFQMDELDAMVNADKDRFHQILINLLENAYKYTNEGTIQLKCRKNEEFLHFNIIDTGIGISAVDQDKIFERFFRVDPFSGGAGLGLSLSKSFANYMGGDISVQSKEGVGSNFEVRIPYLN